MKSCLPFFISFLFSFYPFSPFPFSMPSTFSYILLSPVLIAAYSISVFRSLRQCLHPCLSHYFHALSLYPITRTYPSYHILISCVPSFFSSPSSTWTSIPRRCRAEANDIHARPHIPFLQSNPVRSNPIVKQDRMMIMMYLLLQTDNRSPLLLQ